RCSPFAAAWRGDEACCPVSASHLHKFCGVSCTAEAAGGCGLRVAARALARLNNFFSGSPLFSPPRKGPAHVRRTPGPALQTAKPPVTDLTDGSTFPHTRRFEAQKGVVGYSNRLPRQLAACVEASGRPRSDQESIQLRPLTFYG